MKRFLLVPISVLSAAIGLNAYGQSEALSLSESSQQVKVVSSAVQANEMAQKAAQAKKTRNQKSASTFSIESVDVSSPTAVYIIRLKDPAVAAYSGGIAGFSATNPEMTGEKKLDLSAAPSVAYSNFLEQQQARVTKEFDASIGRRLSPKFSYKNVFNGMAIELTASEAKQLQSHPDVLSIEEERWEVPLTDAGPAWIGADYIWNGGVGDYFSYPWCYKFEGSQGEDMVVAILDSGINSDHPSFADIGGDGYDHTNPLGSGNYLPGSYCDTEDPTFCNDKLIGAWGFTKELGDPTSPEDSDGHGSHTASTVAGNVVNDITVYAPTTSLMRESISGVAPHANIIAYDVCVDSCPGSALLAAVEQVVIDASNLPNGIQALNYSISGGEDPYNDAVELGFLNASNAGIFVSASAGNSGPTASTVAHRSPWVATVGASTHNRAVLNSLDDMTSDGESLPALIGSGFTTSLGATPIVHAKNFPTDNGSINDLDPGQCLEPFPAGHFDGQIVVCDRGEIARTAKGINVAAGGASGFVLANLEANGNSVSNDAHVIPAVHLGVDNANILKDWLDNNTNTMASISGGEVDVADAYGDIMAGFSSRGPNTTDDILKPDVTAPGVNIIAAVASTEGAIAPEYGFLSGTSMSSPHNAGAAALISAIKPKWSPHAIKSAMMMTSTTDFTFKEDGMTPTDPFDLGAGRIDLTKVANSSLVLEETTENFLAANPAIGGDPKTLNIASMQNSNCVGFCTWERTVTNTSEKRYGVWSLYADMDDLSSNVKLRVKPQFLSIPPGESAKIQIFADTTTADDIWQFGKLSLDPFGRHSGPPLHMPIAIKPSVSSNDTVLVKTVDQAQASPGDILNYTVTLTNSQFTDTITLTDMIPKFQNAIPSSLNVDVVNGTTIDDFVYKKSNKTLSWSGILQAGSLAINESPAPFGYVPMSDFTTPFGCPSNCDDGGFVLNVPTFTYNGESYSQVIWSVNGTLQAGSVGGAPTSALNSPLPSTSPPNNLLAPFWTDLDMGSDGDGAEWYVAVLTAGPNEYTIYEWNNIPLFGDDTRRYTFQVWVQNGDSGNIWFVYQNMDDVDNINYSVGIEDETGLNGDSYHFNGTGNTPTPGIDLEVSTLTGGSATFTYKTRVGKCKKPMVNFVEITSEGETEEAITTTACKQ
ncbi:S8 family serine peptidase [Marinibactrum halimedae]|uniref:Peptidase S8 n=1 Tax=Marinibactrum halimedae TaxID=1444977 RepID=A0AA37WL55_9GAMM|nr:S8 family serine peptidase [Marinibactrum halimedae]MCD9457662.1 S8 family serine peptidase [Marinibactrum halimedae]GLS24965.1 peptidase S8 [Marinibactrum halimedae]